MGRLLDSRYGQRLDRRLRRATRGWALGHVVWFDAGPPWVRKDQPTHAPIRLIHHSPSDPPVSVGRYCSINDTVQVIPGGIHPTDRVSTFLFGQASEDGVPGMEGIPFDADGDYANKQWPRGYRERRLDRAKP